MNIVVCSMIMGCKPGTVVPVSVFWFRGPKYSTSWVTKVLGNGGIGTGVLEAVDDCMLPIPEPQQPNSGSDF